MIYDINSAYFKGYLAKNKICYATTKNTVNFTSKPLGPSGVFASSA